MKHCIQIEFLKDYPQFNNEVGRLWHEEWGQVSDKSDENRKLQSVQAKANKGEVPFILIAIIDNVLAGSASAFNHDLKNRPELTPWLAAVVTKPKYRGLGVAEQLTAAVMSECIALGYKHLFLRTEKADKYFSRLGWTLYSETADENSIATRIYDIQLVP